MRKRNIIISLIVLIGVIVVAIFGLKQFQQKNNTKPIDTTVSCSDSNVVKNIRADLASSIQKQVGLEIQSTILDQNLSYDQNALDAIFKSLKVKAANSRVQDQQSSTGTLTCATTIAVTIPAHVYTEADQYQTLEPSYSECEEECGNYRYAQRAANENLEFDGSTTRQASLTYVLQHDTDGNLIVQSQDFDPIKSFVVNAIVNAVDLPNAINRDSAYQLSNEQRESQERKKLDLISQSMDIRLKEVTTEYEQINNQLNSIWQKAGTATTQIILDEQRAWLKKRDIDCEIEAEASPNSIQDNEKQPYELQRGSWTSDMDNKDKEIRRIICVNRVTKERLPVLTSKISEIQEKQI